MALLGIFITIVSASTTVNGLSHEFQRTVLRRYTDEQTVARIRAGMAEAYVESRLGSPLLVVGDSGYVEHTFHGKDWWAQTVSDSDGTVVQYALTGCGSFRPRFIMNGTRFGEPFQGGQPKEFDYEVKLNDDAYSEIQPTLLSAPFNVPGGLPNQSYYEALPHEPETLLGWYVGFNEVCEDGRDINQRETKRINRESDDDFDQPLGTKKPTAAQKLWRSRNSPNTVVSSIYSGNGVAPASFALSVNPIEIAQLR